MRGGQFEPFGGNNVNFCNDVATAGGIVPHDWVRVLAFEL